MAIAMPSPGEGYQVNTSELERAASAAQSAGIDLATLRGSIQSALASAQSVGLGVGTALSQVTPQWIALLDYLASQVTNAGTTLAANASSYCELEQRLASSAFGWGPDRGTHDACGWR